MFGLVLLYLYLLGLSVFMLVLSEKASVVFLSNSHHWRFFFLTMLQVSASVVLSVNRMLPKYIQKIMAKTGRVEPKDIQQELADLERQAAAIERKRQELKTASIQPMIEQREELWAKIVSLNSIINDNWNPYRQPVPPLSAEMKNKIIAKLEKDQEYDMATIAVLTEISKPMLAQQKKNIIAAGVLRETGKKGLTKLYKLA